jgi:hypothetical protein
VRNTPRENVQRVSISNDQTIKAVWYVFKPYCILKNYTTVLYYSVLVETTTDHLRFMGSGHGLTFLMGEYQGTF